MVLTSHDQYGGLTGGAVVTQARKKAAMSGFGGDDDTDDWSFVYPTREQLVDFFGEQIVEAAQ